MREKRIGEILVEKGAIKQHQLKRALEIQAVDKSHIGKILVSENYIGNLDLHEAIAEKFGLEFVDLMLTPPDYALLDAAQRHEYFALQAIPFAENNGVVTIAATSINDDLREWVTTRYAGREVKFVITSPYDITHVIQRHFAGYNDDDARLKLRQELPRYSAHSLFRGFTANIFAAIFIAAFAVAVSFKESLLPVVILMNIFFFLAVSFKNLLFVCGWKVQKTHAAKITQYPVYTILLPLYRETRTLPKLIKAMQSLDYPKSKLDVKFVVEADDVTTINAIKRAKPPQYMEIISVPYSLPRTKPKACNYAMNFARGEFITIYDAEDIPDPKQLKTVLAKFADSNAACVQARLNYDNYRDNILTRWFALEYAIWFDSLMHGLERLKMPVFLGGTSNHIRTAVLREIGGWDAFNVTEDADLGMRLAQEGYITATVNSLTMEEAPNTVKSWAKQRTRWIKGFMQTYFVHMRDVKKLYRNIGFRGFVSLQFLIGIPILIYLSSPILLSTTIVAAGNNFIPDWLISLCWFNLFYGMASHVGMCLLAAMKARKSDGEKLFKSKMIFSACTFYFYGFLHIYAAFRALYQLITAPHYWDKTEHGLAKTSG